MDKGSYVFEKKVKGFMRNRENPGAIFLKFGEKVERFMGNRENLGANFLKLGEKHDR